MTYAPTLVDLSRIAAPDAIEVLSHESLFQGFVARFKAYWEVARKADPTLPPYDVELLEYDPAAIVGQAWSYLRLLDRARVNDAVRAVLAPLAKGADLDNVVARVNVQRLVIAPATLTTPILMEGDESLLRRYLLAFDRPGAGTRDRYLYEAFTAWPLMGDCRVNGWAIHKRRGRVDVVVMAPAGAALTDERLSVVRSAVLADNVRPEAVDVSVSAAVRRQYGVKLVAEIPSGPDGELIRRDILARVRAAALTRTLIAGEVPSGFIAGSAYGPNVLTVRDLAPVSIAPDPYTVPVCSDIEISIEVRR